MKILNEIGAALIILLDIVAYHVTLYLFKVNNMNTRLICWMCPKWVKKPPEWSQWLHFGVLMAIFEYIWRLLKPFPPNALFWLPPPSPLKIWESQKFSDVFKENQKGEIEKKWVKLILQFPNLNISKAATGAFRSN